MKQSCPKCHTIVEINEKEYTPGEKVSRKCPLCDNILIFSIPKEEKKDVVIKEVESEEAKKRIAELEKKVAELEQRKNNPQPDRQTPPVAPRPTPPPQNPVPPRVTPPPQKPVPPTPKPITPIPIKKKRTGTIIFLIFVGILLAIAGTVFGTFYHNNVYIPKKIDREAPRYYTIGVPTVRLRSSCDTAKKYDNITYRCHYGTELIYYGDHYNRPIKKVKKMYKVPYLDDEWCFVKVVDKSINKKDYITGCVNNSVILNKHDFVLLNSIWGNKGCDTIIKSTDAFEKKVLLEYYKDRGYMGLIDDETRKEVGIDDKNNRDNTWQIYTNENYLSLDNSTYPDAFKKKGRVDNGILKGGFKTKSGEEFYYFAVIITNCYTGEHRCVLFIIVKDGDGGFRLNRVIDNPVNHKYIDKIRYVKQNDSFEIDYAD